MNLRERTLQACLVAVGVIHLIPATGVVGPDRLTLLYGVPIAGADLALLMRHRAVLLGILGALLIAAAARSTLRWAALWSGFVSVVSFIALALASGGHNASITGVVAVDVFALALLALAAALQRRGTTAAAK